MEIEISCVSSINDASTMSSKEKSLKSSLVRTRQVIANKFRKLYRKRILQKKQIEETFTPLTESINKLVDSKSKLQAHKNVTENEINAKGDESADDESKHLADDEVFENNAQAEPALDGKTKKPPSLQELSKMNSLEKKLDLDSERRLFADKRKNQRLDRFNQLRSIKDSFTDRSIRMRTILFSRYDNFAKRFTSREKAN